MTSVHEDDVVDEVDGLGGGNLNGAPGDNALRSSVYVATVKLPQFFPGSPGFWFAQAESQFRVK